MNIAFLIRKLDCGGAEKQLIITAKGLSEKGHNVVIYTFYNNGELEYELNGTSVKIIWLEKKGRWDTVNLFFKLNKLIKKNKIEILYSFMYVQNVIAALIKLVKPTLKVVWGIRSSYMDFEKYSRLFKMSFKIESKLSKVPNLIISNSKAGKDYALSNGYINNNFKVIYNGIDVDKFKPNKNAGIEFRNKLNLGEDKKLIGIVGRLDYMKDHETFIKAAYELCKYRNDVLFICIGDGNPDYKKYLINLTKELKSENKFIWYGKSNDVNSSYNSLDILTSTSCGEGFSNVIAEAMASGTPCVVTDVGDSAFIVSGCGKSINPKDINSLVKMWLEVLDLDSSSIEEIKSKSRKRITDNFSIEKMIESTEEELNYIFGGK